MEQAGPSVSASSPAWGLPGIAVSPDVSTVLQTVSQSDGLLRKMGSGKTRASAGQSAFFCPLASLPARSFPRSIAACGGVGSRPCFSFPRACVLLFAM